jgi:hypothetical protein
MNSSSIASFAAFILAGAGAAAAASGCAGTDGDSTSDAGSGADSDVLEAAALGDARTGVDGARPDPTPPVDAGGRPDAVADQSAPDANPEATLDLHQVTIFDNPPGLADWPVTTRITAVEFQYMGQDGVHVEFSKKDGPDSWPDVTPPGWTGPLQYTVGMAEYIGGQWYGSAAIEFWRDYPALGGNVASDIVTKGPCTTFGLGSSCQVAKNWYYDGRWGNLAGYQPATGEMIGIFVVAGNLRGVTDGSQSPVQERSNVVLVPMPGFGGGRYTF